jgi:hypothetical protein
VDGSKPSRMSRIAGILASAVALAAAPTASVVAAANSHVPGRHSSPPQHQHALHSQPATGKFRCGTLRLAINGGREIETFDGDLRHGITRVFISRIWRHVTLAGSDGRTYRASGVTSQWDVLIAPDSNHPVRGQEVIVVDFRGGPDKSPGFLRERLTIRNSHETDVVTGPCNFAK